MSLMWMILSLAFTSWSLGGTELGSLVLTYDQYVKEHEEIVAVFTRACEAMVVDENFRPVYGATIPQVTVYSHMSVPGVHGSNPRYGTVDYYFSCAPNF